MSNGIPERQGFSTCTELTMVKYDGILPTMVSSQGPSRSISTDVTQNHDEKGATWILSNGNKNRRLFRGDR
jgi:hypothetical protein